MKFRSIRNIFFASLFSSALIACSSDDGGGSIGDASIDAENSQDLAIAGTEAVKQGANSDSANIFGTAKIAGSDPMSHLSLLTAESIPKAAEIQGICESGTVDQSGDQNGGTITYNNCVIGGATFNGSATFTSSTANNVTTFSITYNNFTITFEGETTTVSASISCTIDANANTTSCSYDSSAVGIDGRTYSVTDMTVGGDAISGWTISATVTDPDHGNVTISTDVGVLFNCTNGQPSSGQISITDGSSTMTVTYIDCDSYSIDFDGSTTTYNW